MDEAMIARYLASRGMSMSNDNANRVRAHFGSNPAELDRLAMGLPGGANSPMDTRGDTLDQMLDKVIADTAATPAGTVEVGQPQMMSPAASPSPAPRNGGGSRAMPSRQGGYGPGPSPSRQGDYGSGNRDRGIPVALEHGPEGGLGTDVGMLNSGGGGGIGEFLLALLGLSSVAGRNATQTPGAVQGGAAALPGRTDTDQKRLTYEPKIEDKTTRGNYESVGQEMQTIDERNAASKEGRRRELQADIDQENAHQKSLIEQQSKRNKDQKSAEELARAAKRATGRR